MTLLILNASVLDPLREALSDSRLVLGEQGLCQEPQCPHRRLPQLVADVCHEITPHVLEPPAL